MMTVMMITTMIVMMIMVVMMIAAMMIMVMLMMRTIMVVVRSTLFNRWCSNLPSSNNLLQTIQNWPVGQSYNANSRKTEYCFWFQTLQKCERNFGRVPCYSLLDLYNFMIIIRSNYSVNLVFLSKFNISQMSYHSYFTLIISEYTHLSLFPQQCFDYR